MSKSISVPHARGSADDGKRLSGDGRYAYVSEALPEERSGEEIHVAIFSGPTLADCSQIIYIYIYIRKLNFLGSLFLRGFGEVLERDLGDQKLQKHCVLQCLLIATIKIPKVFLGFSTFGEG